MEVCVDAGVAVKVALVEQDSELAARLFQRLALEGRQVIAPHFCEVEADSIVRKKIVLRREITQEEGAAAAQKVRDLPIQSVAILGQRELAWAIADRFGFPTVYDATYLALAELRGCNFWTADERLYNRVRAELPYVHLLSHFQLP